MSESMDCICGPICRYCNGTGEERGGENWRPCGFCDGTGQESVGRSA